MDNAYIWIPSRRTTWPCKYCKSFPRIIWRYSFWSYHSLTFSYWNPDYPHVKWQVVSLISERFNQQLIQRIVPRRLSSSWEYILVSTSTPFPDGFESNTKTLYLQFWRTPASAPFPLEFLKVFHITSSRLSMRVRSSGGSLPVVLQTASVSRLRIITNGSISHQYGRVD